MTGHQVRCQSCWLSTRRNHFANFLTLDPFNWWMDARYSFIISAAAAQPKLRGQDDFQYTPTGQDTNQPHANTHTPTHPDAERIWHRWCRYIFHIVDLLENVNWTVKFGALPRLTRLNGLWFLPHTLRSLGDPRRNARSWKAMVTMRSLIEMAGNRCADVLKGDFHGHWVNNCLW